jgi:hypothetical protein
MFVKNLESALSLPGMQCAGLSNGVKVSATPYWADNKERHADVFIMIRQSKNSQGVGGCYT